MTPPLKRMMMRISKKTNWGLLKIKLVLQMIEVSDLKSAAQIDANFEGGAI